uniref:Protein serine/threonine phosphatase 2C C-terminal domain-containing protein n=1 Tax=Gadus morhua TaxID=8049 RepID=A0A8C5CVG0_GADMO
MSVVLVSLPGAPKVTEEALKKEEDLDKYLESRVEGKYGLGSPTWCLYCGAMATETVPNLPPGGGLASKRSVIEAMYNRLNLYREEEGVSSSV